MYPRRIIKLLRTAEGISQVRFAEELGVSRSYVSQVENGKKEPGLVFLREAARILHVPVALLLVDESEPAIASELREILGHVLSVKMKRNNRGEEDEGKEVAEAP